MNGEVSTLAKMTHRKGNSLWHYWTYWSTGIVCLLVLHWPIGAIYWSIDSLFAYWSYTGVLVLHLPMGAVLAYWLCIFLRELYWRIGSVFAIGSVLASRYRNWCPLSNRRATVWQHPWNDKTSVGNSNAHIYFQCHCYRKTTVFVLVLCRKISRRLFSEEGLSTGPVHICYNGAPCSAWKILLKRDIKLTAVKHFFLSLRHIVETCIGTVLRNIYTTLKEL